MKILFKKIVFTLPLLLSACGGSPWFDYSQDYRLQNQLSVQQQQEVLDLNLATSGLVQPQDETILVEYVNKFKTRGDGILEINVPFAPDKKEYAKIRGQNLAEKIAALGAPSDNIGIRLIPLKSDRVWVSGEKDKGEHYHPARLLFSAYEVALPECGKWEQSHYPSMNNQPSSNFGCATQRNIGLMIANPKDLVKQRTRDAYSGARAADVVDKYKAGIPTGSADEVSAAIVGGGSN